MMLMNNNLVEIGQDAGYSCVALTEARRILVEKTCL